MKIFVVEDSEVVRERLKLLLTEVSEVEIIGEAETQTEAIALITELKPDVVILDIRLANGSGIDVLHNIKKGKSVPMVIILTNYPYPQYKEKCLKAGADYFFDKSSEFNKIAEVLETKINSY